MSLVEAKQVLDALSGAVSQNNVKAAATPLERLNRLLLELDSLPPLCVETPQAPQERRAVQDCLELALIVAVRAQDKTQFGRYWAALEGFYLMGPGPHFSTASSLTALALRLLHLLVENRLADFHALLELLSAQESASAEVRFVTEVEKSLETGAYDKVLSAAAHPPRSEFSFFLSSLLDTVRLNIAECMSVSYEQLSLGQASRLLMFQREEEAAAFVADACPHWRCEGGQLHFAQDGGGRMEVEGEAGRALGGKYKMDVPRLIANNLAYAIELERIV